MTCIARTLSPIAVLALPLVAAASDGDHAGEAHDHAHGEAAAHGHAHDHVHGAGELEVRIEGFLVETALTLPGGNLFGDLEKPGHTAARAAEIVSGPESLVALPEAAGCSVTTSNITVREIAEGDHGGHTDWTLSFGQFCAEPDALTALEVVAFEAIPELESAKLVIEGDRRFRLEAEVAPGSGPITLVPFMAPAVN